MRMTLIVVFFMRKRALATPSTCCLAQGGMMHFTCHNKS